MSKVFLKLNILKYGPEHKYAGAIEFATLLHKFEEVSEEHVEVYKHALGYSGAFGDHGHRLTIKVVTMMAAAMGDELVMEPEEVREDLAPLDLCVWQKDNELLKKAWGMSYCEDYLKPERWNPTPRKEVEDL